MLLFQRTIVLLLFIFCSDSWALDKNAWNPINNPENIADTATFLYNFDSLPTEGIIQHSPWPDSYWPTYKRGLAQRWMGILYVKPMPNKKKLIKMSKKEINLLSPAEKYDIYVGNYDYYLTKSELERTSPDAPAWEGLCHGWAVASLLFKEPKPITVTNDDGIEITFGSSDLKGLITYLQGNSHEPIFFAGDRCTDKFNVNTFTDRNDECSDINAGAFHVILANHIGILKKGFVMDVTTDQEVWNQPVQEYKTEVVREQNPTKDAAEGTVKELVMTTLVTYTIETDPNYSTLLNEEEDDYDSEDSVAGEPGDNFRVKKIYDYILELDKNKNIIGGKWISKDYPDFVWTKKKATFKNYFAPLENLYKRATR